MERQWYHLSTNVLEEMIKFVPRCREEDCPNFLLEIEAVEPTNDRYLLTLIDGTNKSIFCVTSSGYTKNFRINEAVAGTMIRIFCYWLFRIQCNFGEQNKDEFKYIVMITSAEIAELPATKAIASVTRFAAKTPRVRGIVDVCPDGSYTGDGRSSVRFRLSDHTGSIGCSASGAMYAPLYSILKHGVKVELSHAVATEVDPANKIWDHKFELELNQFSVLKIYNPDDLTLLFSYSPHDIVEKSSDRPNMNLLDEPSSQPIEISNLPNEPSSSQLNSLPSSKSLSEPIASNKKSPSSSDSLSELSALQKTSLPLPSSSDGATTSREKSVSSSSASSSFPRKTLPSSIVSYNRQNCMNGETPVPIASLTKPGICKFWIRGIVECHNSSLLSARTNSVFMRFHVRDDSAIIRCTVWDPICTPLNPVLEDGMIVEITDAQVRQVPADSKISDHNYELYLTKFATIFVLSSNRKIVYRYVGRVSSVTNLGKDNCRSESGKSSMVLDSKLIDGKLPKDISSLSKEGYCNEWIRGIVEDFHGIATTRTNRNYVRFFVRDNTSNIHCTVWQPICVPLSRIIKDGMIVEIRKYKVLPVRSVQMCAHKFEINLNSFTSIRVYTADGTLLHENMAA